MGIKHEIGMGRYDVERRQRVQSGSRIGRRQRRLELAPQYRPKLDQYLVLITISCSAASRRSQPRTNVRLAGSRRSKRYAHRLVSTKTRTRQPERRSCRDSRVQLCGLAEVVRSASASRASRASMRRRVAST